MWFVDEEIDKVVRRQGCSLVPPSDAQLPVMADALNVHEATGLTPSQLQARVAELEAALSGMVEFFQPYACGSEDNRADALQEARRALGEA